MLRPAARSNSARVAASTSAYLPTYPLTWLFRTCSFAVFLFEFSLGEAVRREERIGKREERMIGGGAEGKGEEVEVKVVGKRTVIDWKGY